MFNQLVQFLAGVNALGDILTAKKPLAAHTIGHKKFLLRCTGNKAAVRACVTEGGPLRESCMAGMTQ